MRVTRKGGCSRGIRSTRPGQVSSLFPPRFKRPGEGRTSNTLAQARCEGTLHSSHLRWLPFPLLPLKDTELKPFAGQKHRGPQVRGQASWRSRTKQVAGCGVHPCGEGSQSQSLSRQRMTTGEEPQLPRGAATPRCGESGHRKAVSGRKPEWGEGPRTAGGRGQGSHRD